MFSNEGSTVLDPCAGSGTVGRSAILTNRNYILFDLNPDGKTLFKKSIENLVPVEEVAQQGSNALVDALY